MDFAIQSLLPKATDRASDGNVVDDPGEMAEEFAKLLVAQISNQDPEEPLDATEIISQNAQFTASLATVRLANQMAHYEQVASSMRSIGKIAEYVFPGDVTETSQVGVVSGIDYSTAPPGLIIDGQSIPMDNIRRIDSAGEDTNASAQTNELQRLKQMQMLGKTVEYFNPGDGSVVTGVVDDVDLISASGLVTVNGQSIPSAEIIRIIN